MDGVNFDAASTELVHPRDSSSSEARFIVVPIEHAVGRVVRARFHFDDKWLLMSEVHFVSS